MLDWFGDITNDRSIIPLIPESEYNLNGCMDACTQWPNRELMAVEESSWIMNVESDNSSR